MPEKKKAVVTKVVVKKVNIKIDPKIHINKYFNTSDYTDGIKAFLKARFGNVMFVKTEWKSRIDKELKKRII